MSRTRKMVNLSIEETSGVDHPAHLQEGWLVMKSADTENVQQLLDSTLNQEVSKMEKSMEEQLQEAQDALMKAEERIAELEKQLSDMNSEAEKQDGEEEDVEMKKSADDILKSAPESVVKMVEDLRKQAQQASEEAEVAKATLLAQQEAVADKEAIEKASVWKHLNLNAEQVGPVLRRLAKQDEELAKNVEEILNSVNAQAESANIFAEIGKSADYVNANSAYEKMTAMAKSAVSNGSAPSIEQALANIAVQNPELYAQYASEKR